MNTKVVFLIKYQELITQKEYLLTQLAITTLEIELT